MSFRETREMLLLAYDSKIISDEEFLVLWESCRSKNPDFPYSSYARFDLETFTKPSVWQSSESKNKTFLCWQTFFNYQWTSVVHKEQSVIELKVYACYWEGFLILVAIQIWSADLEDQFQSYAWLRTKSWTTFSTITATEYLNGMTIFWTLICYRSMLMSYMQKAPH